MSVQLVNAAGGAVSLIQSSVVTHKLPEGFVGGLNLTGAYAASLNGYVTNGFSSHSQVLSGGTTSDGISFFKGGDPIHGPGGIVIYASDIYFNGTNFYHAGPGSNLVHVGANITYMYQGIQYPLGTVGDALTNTIAFTFDTNLVAGTVLGTFDANSAVKSVEFYPTSLATTDYALEFTVITAAFVLAGMGYLMERVWRVIRAVRSNSPD